MKNLLLVTIALLLFAVGCYKYDPQFDGPYEDGEIPVSVVSYEILTVENGRIYLYNKRLETAKTLDNLPSGIEKAAINYAHDRIAYQVAGSDIVIVDTLGATLGRVDNSASAAWFDWHDNDRSLYILSNFQLTLWGEPLTVGASDLSVVFPFGSTDQEMQTAAVLADGSVVAAYSYYAGFFTGYESKIAILPLSGSRWESAIGDYEPVRWLRADRTGQRIRYGSGISNSEYKIWQLDAGQRYNAELFYGQLQAPSPKADYVVAVGSGQLKITHLVSGVYYSGNFSNTFPTTLDW